MCGIVGYVGHKEAAPILLKGLHQLEYRGYDSAGVALTGEGQSSISVFKAILLEDGCLKAFYRPYALGDARGTFRGQCPSSSVHVGRLGVGA